MRRVEAKVAHHLKVLRRNMAHDAMDEDQYRPGVFMAGTLVVIVVRELQGNKRANIRAKVEQCGRTIGGVSADEPDVFRGPSWLGETNQYPFGRVSQRV